MPFLIVVNYWFLGLRWYPNSTKLGIASDDTGTYTSMNRSAVYLTLIQLQSLWSTGKLLNFTTTPTSDSTIATETTQ